MRGGDPRLRGGNHVRRSRFFSPGLPARAGSGGSRERSAEGGDRGRHAGGGAVRRRTVGRQAAGSGAGGSPELSNGANFQAFENGVRAEDLRQRRAAMAAASPGLGATIRDIEINGKCIEAPKNDAPAGTSRQGMSSPALLRPCSGAGFLISPTVCPVDNVIWVIVIPIPI
jgi:hypothetical protein